MASWDDGYVTDIVYTSNFYRECTPVWLTTACLLLGHRAPDLTKPFRYADLGCGHGFTALTVAATCPQAEVWGFDFNPAHIDSARSLATRAGLTNVHFAETSFADLARAGSAGLRLHGLAWGAELDLAGEPGAPDRGDRPAAAAGRSGVPEL